MYVLYVNVANRGVDPLPCVYNLAVLILYHVHIMWQIGVLTLYRVYIYILECGK